MIDYKKAEQAKRLLDESGVDYILAYAKENGCTAGQVQGNALKVADCIVAAMQSVGKLIRDTNQRRNGNAYRQFFAVGTYPVLWMPRPFLS